MEKKKLPKKFVLDTNVMLHDYKCLYSFEENDVCIPIVVLEELDRFKKGNEQINFNAREFTRELDSIADGRLFEGGVSLGDGLGKLTIEPDREEFPPKIRTSFANPIPDHRVLAIAYYLKEENPNTKVILITKDINLRMKALSVGIESEDYINDKVTNINIFDKNHESYDNVTPELIEKLYSAGVVSADELEFHADLYSQECFVLKSNRSSVLARYIADRNEVKRVEKTRCFGIEPRNAEQTFAFDILLDDNVKLAALTGKSGTGKTLLALAAALQKHESYKQILLARPIVALSNRDLGYLPGDENQKISPYMQPLFDNLNVIRHNLSYQGREVRQIDEMQSSKQLIIEALAYIRGRSLSDTFFIIDEAQNLTPHEVKTIITRAGEGTKIVFTGDIQQIDSPYLDTHSNGLVYMIDRMHGQDIFAHVNLLKGERSKLSELASNLL